MQKHTSCKDYNNNNNNKKASHEEFVNVPCTNRPNSQSKSKRNTNGWPSVACAILFGPAHEKGLMFFDTLPMHMRRCLGSKYPLAFLTYAINIHNCLATHTHSCIHRSTFEDALNARTKIHTYRWSVVLKLVYLPEYCRAKFH